MALIKTLKDFFTKSEIYPKTKTNAVYDDHFGRLDNFLSNHAIGAEEVDDMEGEEVELRDADTLGGRYTAEDLDAMPKSTAIEDYAKVEPPIVDADYLGGKKASEYALNSNLMELKKNNLGSDVKIEDRTETNKYTCPSDGYIRLYVPRASTGYVRARIESANENGNYIAVSVFANTQDNAFDSVFVKKGMKVLVVSSVGDFTLRFIPLE